MLNAEAVSVIVPVYNGERFLGAALESIATQTVPPGEVIVVDDGSTDRTASIAEAFRPARLIRQSNRGPAAARHDLIAFLDHDDLWSAHKVEVQGRRMSADPDLGYTIAAHRMFLEPGHTRPAWLRPDLLDRAVPGVVTGTLMARRWVFDRVGVFDPRYGVADDSDWFMRARDAGIRAAALDEVLLLRRVHDENVSASPRGSGDLLRAVRASLERRRDIRPAGP